MAITKFNAIDGVFGGNGGFIPTTTVQAGNPNTVVAGSSFAGQIGDIYFDTTGAIGYTCTVGGASATAVWAADGASASAFGWNNTTGTTQAMVVNNGYVSNNAAQSTFTLPTTAAVGQRVAVSGAGAAGFIIAQNASQLVHIYGSAVTTTGTGGNITSTDAYDAVELLCITANTTWKVQSVKGNPTYT